MLEGSASGGSGDGDKQGGGNNSNRFNIISSNDGDVKRAAESKILCYHQSLTRGCGDSACTNVNCVSSGKVSLTVNIMLTFKLLFYYHHSGMLFTFIIFCYIIISDAKNNFFFAIYFFKFTYS